MRGEISAAFLVILTAFAAAFGQTPQPTPRPAPSRNEAMQILRQQQARERDRQQRSEALERLQNLGAERTAPGERVYFPAKPKRSREQEKSLQPRAEDFHRYADFLRQPKTGLFRLMPDLDCTPNTNVIRATEECLSYIPGSSFYSFREAGYTLEALSDIRYKDGLLFADAVLSQGILVALGDVPPENVSLGSDGMKFLVEYQPNASSDEALKQHTQIANGVKAGRYVYRKFQPALENVTYALRMVAYRGKLYRTFRGFRYNVLEGDERKDIIVVFRIVRREKDGSVALLWKELARADAPKIVYPKKADKK